MFLCNSNLQDFYFLQPGHYCIIVPGFPGMVKLERARYSPQGTSDLTRGDPTRPLWAQHFVFVTEISSVKCVFSWEGKLSLCSFLRDAVIWDLRMQFGFLRVSNSVENLLGSFVTLHRQQFYEQGPVRRWLYAKRAFKRISVRTSWVHWVKRPVRELTELTFVHNAPESLYHH